MLFSQQRLKTLFQKSQAAATNSGGASSYVSHTGERRDFILFCFPFLLDDGRRGKFSSFDLRKYLTSKSESDAERGP